ncbi:hypothetical protein GGI26_001363 [Coemansia sp. RSA 1358]|nr:hypothetical protein GGI26_001363 [Coemansia sp. RSA 1358]
MDISASAALEEPGHSEGNISKRLQPTVAELRAAALSSLRAKALATKNEASSNRENAGGNVFPRNDQENSLTPSIASNGAELSVTKKANILNTPGRYSTEIQGELIPVTKTKSTVNSKPAVASNGEEADFESLLAQYQNNKSRNSQADDELTDIQHYATSYETPFDMYASQDASYNGTEGLQMWMPTSFGNEEQYDYRPAYSQSQVYYDPTVNLASNYLDMVVYDNNTPQQTSFLPPSHLASHPLGHNIQHQANPIAARIDNSEPPLRSLNYGSKNYQPQNDGLLSEGELEADNASMSLSDGELDAYADDANMSLSDGEVYEHLDSAESLQHFDKDVKDGAGLLTNDVDVESVIKGRIDAVLKNRDPKLLKGAQFRALMLLLKCIKQDDPDAIFAQVRGAPFQVAAELNALSHEFGLGMITDACMNTLLVSGASAAAPSTILCHSPDSDSQSVDMDMRSSSDSSESSRGVDMDTSSDMEYGELQQMPEQQPVQQMAESALQTHPLSRESTPLTPLQFSRSRAPSPPSTLQLRAPRTIPQTNHSLAPFSVSTSKLPLRAESGTYSPLHGYSGSAFGTWNTDVCNSEYGRLVVFLGSSDESSGSESDTEWGLEHEDDKKEVPAQRSMKKQLRHWASAKARRREARMLNKECRRLAFEDSQSILRTYSFSNLNRPGSGTGYVSSPASQSSRLAVTQASNSALNLAKMSLKAHEDAIAQLKLQISRKQTAALLRKKLYESKFQRSTEPTLGTVSAPVTPCSNEDDTSALDAQIPAHSIQTDVSESSLSTLPNSSDCKAILQNIPVEKRATHLNSINAALSDAIEIKRTELYFISQDTFSGKIESQEQINRLFSDIPLRLDDKQKKLEAQKEHFNRLIGMLQAQLKLADIEMGILEYSRNTINECRTTSEMAAPSQAYKVDSSSTVMDRQSRADMLRNDIKAIRQLKEMLLPSAKNENKPQTTTELIAADSNEAPSPTKGLTAGTSQSADIQNDSSNDNSDTNSKKQHIELLKTKLATMQAEQIGMSQKLASLTKKREQLMQQSQQPAKSRDALEDSTKLPPAKKQKITLTNGESTPTSLCTKVAMLIDIVAPAAAENKMVNGHENIHAEISTRTIDSCILQPLLVSDGIGMSSLANPAAGILLDIGTTNCRSAISSRTQMRISGSMPAASKVSPLSDTSYVPYDSPIGSTFVKHTSKSFAAATDGLSKVTTEDLMEAVRAEPVAHPSSVKQYYKEINDALCSLCKNNSVEVELSNKLIAETLVPIWKTYARILRKGAISKKNPLYAEIGLSGTYVYTDDIATIVGYHQAAILRSKEKRTMRRVLLKNIDSPPVLNHDLAYKPKLNSRPPKKTGFSKPDVVGYGDRYFETDLNAADDSGSDIDDSDSGSGSSADADPESGSDTDAELDNAPYEASEGGFDIGERHSSSNTAEQSYKKALHYLRRGFQYRNGVALDTGAYGHLHVETNKRVGRAMLYLKNLLQLHPQSEKLWDLYLELYSRQNIEEIEIVSAFSDATKFHSRSICIWRRYVQWCGWNTLHNASSRASSTSWQGRLSMVTSMAIKFLSAEHSTMLSEDISAAIAEMVVYFWDCTWAVLESQSAAASGSTGTSGSAVQFKSRIMAHMHACFTANSVKVLCSEISGMRTHNNSVARSNGTGGAWKSSEWFLGRILLPHHLLFIGQIFLYSFIEASFVPRSVLVRMYAALQAGLHCQSTYFLCLDNAAESKMALDKNNAINPRLQPYVISVIRKLLGNIKDIILKCDKDSTALSPDCSSGAIIQSSADLCFASIRVTLLQLKKHLQEPTRSISMVVDYEEAMHFINTQPLESMVAKKDILQAILERCMDKPILITCILCNGNDGESGGFKFEYAAYILREHAIMAAQSMDFDTSAYKQHPWLSACDDIKNRDHVIGWIADARQLYYKMVGYVGSLHPISERMLAMNLVSERGDIQNNAAAIRKRFYECSGVWSNIALIEIMYAFYKANSDSSISQQTITSALLWLRHGITALDTANTGGRAQLWAMIMHISMLNGPLQQSELGRMHRANECFNEGRRTLHTVFTCFSPVNFILFSVLDAKPSDDTINAIGHYVSHLASNNAELAIR